MKRNIKRLPALLLAVILCLGLLPGTALAADFPGRFYASITASTSSSAESFGTVTRSSSNTLTYNEIGVKTDHVIYGMEYAGGAFFTVEGTRGRSVSQDGESILTDDGWRELRMYNSDLSGYHVIGEVSEKNYAIVDTAIDLSGAEPALYGTYNTVIPDVIAMSMICTIDLETAKPGNYLQVTGLPEMHIIYAMAFDKDGTLYAIGADAGAAGGPATLYTIDLNNVQEGAYGSKTVAATKIEAIESQTGNPISTNFCQDMAFDHATGTLYWMENDENILYTVDTQTAEATYNSKSSQPLQSFCIPYDAPLGQGEDQYMVSVIYTGGGTVTNKTGGEEKIFYLVDSGESLTLALTPDQNGKLLSVKVDGQSKSVNGLTEYTFDSITESHVIEVTFRENLPVTQKDMTWFHYQGRPASFYTQHHAYEFYDLPYTTDAPKDGYTQTLLDSEGNAIPDNECIIAGNYDVRVTHPGTEDYNALDVVFEDALQLAKCPGTPGRPVVYGKVGCKQGDLTTTSALQDYYRTNGELIDSAHDEIPVTLEWLEPETTYAAPGYYFASATIHAAQNLDDRLKACYNLDDGVTSISGGCQISSRATQVVVLAADQASLIKLQTSDASGGTVSGKGVYKNGDTVTVTATVNANDGYEFKGWQENGQTVSTDAAYTFSAEKDRTLTALFEVDEDYRVTLQTDPQGGGTVTGGGSYEDEPHSATVKATPNQGYYFIGWYAGEEQKNTNAEYTFTVGQEGIALTAKFGIDYLARAEQAQKNLKDALGTGEFEWSMLTQAVDAYEKAKDFVATGVGSTWTDAETRFNDLTDYYSGIEELDLSNQGIGSADLAKLALFTGVTELNLSGNKGISDLTALKDLTQL